MPARGFPGHYTSMSSSEIGQATSNTAARTASLSQTTHPHQLHAQLASPRSGTAKSGQVNMRSCRTSAQWLSGPTGLAAQSMTSKKPLIRPASKSFEFTVNIFEGTRNTNHHGLRTENDAELKSPREDGKERHQSAGQEAEEAGRQGRQAKPFILDSKDYMPPER